MTSFVNIKDLRQYLRDTNDSWNYITPLDFYNNYYLKKKIIFY